MNDKTEYPPVPPNTPYLGPLPLPGSDYLDGRLPPPLRQRWLRVVAIVGLVLLCAAAGFGGGMAGSYLHPVPGPRGETGVPGQPGPAGPAGIQGPPGRGLDPTEQYGCYPLDLYPRDAQGYLICFLGRRAR